MNFLIRSPGPPLRFFPPPPGGWAWYIALVLEPSSTIFIEFASPVLFPSCRGDDDWEGVVGSSWDFRMSPFYSFLEGLLRCPESEEIGSTLVHPPLCG